MSTTALALIVLLLPLAAAVVAGIGGRQIGRRGAHSVAIGCVAVSTALSVVVLYRIVVLGQGTLDVTLYTWMQLSALSLSVGLLIDELSATMMLLVSFVSLMVHIYSIGYMDHDEDYPDDDPYYQRFFSYIALFTFAMLTLVMANNFLQLFFGWEAVGLVSYLLIGFYMKRPSAVAANLKAFLVNRVGDFGFLLGIAGILMLFGTLDYGELFAAVPDKSGQPISIGGGYALDAVTVIAILLFVGAMGKSAQMPLHVWLPESMEGPTPISALIHAATMVTAGIFMVARLSPLYEYSEVASTVVLLTGATTALLMGFLGVVQNDIKRIVAYSTLSQLGYMVAALGVSAYAVGFFHVTTHAFFKALLFLGAGSVIIALHHRQDIREMGGLKKHMPITWVCMLVGTLSLIGTPFFSGFYSKEYIVYAVEASDRFGSSYASFALQAGLFFTALYSCRLLFRVFHGEESEYVKAHPPRESPLVVTLPLILLAIPSAGIGFLLVDGWLFNDYFDGSIKVLDSNNVLLLLGQSWEGAAVAALHSLATLPFFLTAAGVLSAWYFYLNRPDLPAKLVERYALLYRCLCSGYGFDAFNDWFFVRGARKVGGALWHGFDVGLIDNGIVGAGSKGIAGAAARIRSWQSGYLYHYAFVTITGLMLLLGWLVFA